MNYEQMNNNKVYLHGTIEGEPTLSHEAYGEGFYELSLVVKRLSEHSDVIPITISEKLIQGNHIVSGSNIAIKGQLRSYNKMIDGKSKLLLTVFVREIVQPMPDVCPNIIELSGYICKPSIFRITPFKREICDMLVAVNRAYNKSDYLPCIAWGRNARYVKDIAVGEKVVVLGRIQSRDYQKKLGDGSVNTKVAFEVSVSQIQCESKNVVPFSEQAEAEHDTSVAEN